MQLWLWVLYPRARGKRAWGSTTFRFGGCCHGNTMAVFPLLLTLRGLERAVLVVTARYVLRWVPKTALWIFYKTVACFCTWLGISQGRCRAHVLDRLAVHSRPIAPRLFQPVLTMSQSLFQTVKLLLSCTVTINSNSYIMDDSMKLYGLSKAHATRSTKTLVSMTAQIGNLR